MMLRFSFLLSLLGFLLVPKVSFTVVALELHSHHDINALSNAVGTTANETLPKLPSNEIVDAANGTFSKLSPRAVTNYAEVSYLCIYRSCDFTDLASASTMVAASWRSWKIKPAQPARGLLSNRSKTVDGLMSMFPLVWRVWILCARRRGGTLDLSTITNTKFVEIHQISFQC